MGSRPPRTDPDRPPTGTPRGGGAADGRRHGGHRPRRKGRPQGSGPAPRPRGDIDRRRVPLFVPESRARATGARDHSGRIPRSGAPLALARGLPETTGVRAHVDDAGECLRRSSDRPLRGQTRGGPFLRRVRARAPVGHLFGGRGHTGGRQDTTTRHDELRADGWRGRGGTECGPGRAGQCRQRRHGRDELRRLPHS